VRELLQVLLFWVPENLPAVSTLLLLEAAQVIGEAADLFVEGIEFEAGSAKLARLRQF
jgi:hypothetical protein